MMTGIVPFYHVNLERFDGVFDYRSTKASSTCVSEYNFMNVGLLKN